MICGDVVTLGCEKDANVLDGPVSTLKSASPAVDPQEGPLVRNRAATLALSASVVGPAKPIRASSAPVASS